MADKGSNGAGTLTPNEQEMSSYTPIRTKDLVRQWIVIGAVVASYWFISITMVFLNKYLLSSPDLKLDAPLFITVSQSTIAIIICCLLGLIGDSYPAVGTFPPAQFDLTTALKIMPLSVIFVSMITFNNLALKYLGVAFYNVGRSLTTVFNVIFSFTILQQSISFLSILCCGIIVGGFVLGIDQEGKSLDLSVPGVLCGVLASMSVALNAIFTKKVLPVVDSNLWRLQLYNNVNALVLLIPLSVLFGEVSVLKSFEYWTTPWFYVLLVIAGTFGVAIGYVSGLQIKVTSPLTHNISGTAKACAQTILAVVAYREVKTLLWWLSNALVIAGSTAYTLVRMREMKAQAEAKAQEKAETKEHP